MPLHRWHASPASSAVLLAVSLVLATGSVAAAATPKPPRPALRVTPVEVPARATAGAPLVVRVVLASSSHRVRRAMVSARLERAGATALALLPPRRLTLRRGSARATLRPRVPAATAAGAYRLVVCASAGAAKHCSAGRKVAVVRPTTQHPCSCVQLPPRPTGGDAGTPTPGTSAPSALPVDFTAAPNPVDVHPDQDVARRATKTIGPMGGTVEAVGAHGEHYVLEVPEKALLAETAISVTPLTKVDGLPFAGGLIAGAQLAPDGLRFLQPATLTITGAPAVDAAHETGFGYRGDGRDLGLAPMVLDPKVQAFPLMHFSAVGIASGTDAERRALLVRQTSEVESQLQQITGFEVQMGRYHGLTGEGRPMDTEVLQWAFKAYYDQVVLPLLQAALTDDALAPRAIAKALSWSRQLQLMLGKDGFAAERDTITTLMQEIFTNLARHAIAKCRAGDPGQIPILLAASRQAQLLGYPVADDVGKGLIDCASFELDFDTTIDQVRGGEHQPYHGHLMIDHLPLELSGGFNVMGTGTFSYPAFSIAVAPHAPGVGCWLGADGWEHTGDLLAFLSLDVNWVEDVDGGAYQPVEADVADARVVLAFLTRENWLWADCGSSTGTGGTTSWLSEVFREMHDAPGGDAHLPTIQGWDRSSSGPLVLTKQIDRSATIDGEATTEHTTLTLRHTPKGA